MAGRRPKPTALHRLQGTYNATDHRDRMFEAIAEGDLRSAPPGLTDEQRALWRYAIKHAPRSILKKIDREVLRMWVETFDRRHKAQQILFNEPTSIAWSLSPCHRIIDRTTTLLIRLGSELGFSPAARPRIHMAPEVEIEDDNDPWAKLRLVRGGLSDVE